MRYPYSVKILKDELALLRQQHDATELSWLTKEQDHKRQMEAAELSWLIKEQDHKRQMEATEKRLADLETAIFDLTQHDPCRN